MTQELIAVYSIAVGEALIIATIGLWLIIRS